MKKILFLTAVFSLLLFSCDDSTENNGKTRTFWAQNFTNERFYQVEAELLAEGNRCNVWVEKNSGVSKSTAVSIANTYDRDIYDKMINTFGEKNISYEGYTFTDTMMLADALADRDRKLCILVLDIKDSYKKGVNESFVSGYFWAVNLFEYDPAYPVTRNSNKCDMIYIDSNPGKPGTKASNTTLAHEMQHLMNFISTVLHRLEESGAMDTWIDEGLSAAAEWTYLGEHPEIRWKWINAKNGGLIDKGNNFYVWGNREKEDQYAILDDYATVYLFFQWLRLQADSTSIYKDIISSNNNDYRAVTNAAKTKIDANYNTWSALLGDWMAANYINSAAGRYGYKNDAELSQIKAPVIASYATTVSLYPGEGVYSVTSGQPSISGQGANIKNSYLTSTQPNGSFSTGSTLLTYNSNTDNSDNMQAEQGAITGVMPPSTSVNIHEGRFAGAPLSGPFPIGAGDLLKRNGKGENFFINDIKTLKTDAVNE